jgi:hypothetical protein
MHGQLIGTVVFGIRKDGFVVLGVDSLSSAYVGGVLTPVEPARKVVLHPSLPLALATAGFARLPLNSGGRPLGEYLTEIVNGVTDPSQLTIQALFDRLMLRLCPLVLQARQLPNLSMPAPLQKLDVFIALVRDGQAELAQVRMAGEITRQEKPAVLTPPECLNTFYSSGAYQNDAFLFGEAINNADELAAHVEQVLEQGIDHEAALNGGQNRAVSRPVQVAIVEARGARLR